VEGLGEWLDLEFTEVVEPAAVRSRLQQELPPGCELLEASEVPVSGPSLAQELEACDWSLALAAGDEISEQRWQEAVAALLAADQLIWNDTDKKGRPRQRDCRPALRSLVVERLEGPLARLRLGAVIDPAGRSLKPEQLRQWLEQRLGCSLELVQQRRQRLTLRPVVAFSQGKGRPEPV